MQTLRQALDLGLITKVTMTTKGLTIYSAKKPNGATYSWDFYEKSIQPKLEAKVNTLEPQA